MVVGLATRIGLGTLIALATVAFLPVPAGAARATRGGGVEARTDVAKVAPGATVVVDVLANDLSTDGTLEPSTLKVVAKPRFGTATVDKGRIRYAAGESVGTAVVAYEVCSSGGSCGQGSVLVTVEVGAPSTPTATTVVPTSTSVPGTRDTTPTSRPATSPSTTVVADPDGLADTGPGKWWSALMGVLLVGAGGGALRAAARRADPWDLLAFGGRHGRALPATDLWTSRRLRQIGADPVRTLGRGEADAVDESIRAATRELVGIGHGRGAWPEEDGSKSASSGRDGGPAISG